MKPAAVDIGSDSIKLVVLDSASADSFAVLARDKETARSTAATRGACAA